MIEYKKGSLFDAMATNENVILAHACNCRGRWGSGVALQFNNRFPNAYLHYQKLCKEYGHTLLGKTYFVKESENSNVWIACLFTSDGYAETLDPEEKILSNTESAIQDLYNLSSGIDINMPKINAGLFRVPWEKTEAIINNNLPSDQKVIVWEF